MNRNRRITYLKRTATAAVCFSLTAVNALPVMAAESPEKEENVYASLADDGTVEGIYVVNEYDLEKDTKITDTGIIQRSRTCRQRMRSQRIEMNIQ